MWQLEGGGQSGNILWCGAVAAGLGAVKALTIGWALLGVKDAQDLLAAPHWAGRSSPVYVLQLCVCEQHTTLVLGFQSLPCGRVRNPLPFPWAWFVSGFWLMWHLPLTQMSLLLSQRVHKMRTIFSVSG